MTRQTVTSRARDVVGHAVTTVARTPGRAAAFGAAAVVASALLVLGLTDAASRQADVSRTFDELAAQTVQLTTPLRGTVYSHLAAAHVDAIAALPGVTGVGWASSREVRSTAADGSATSIRVWTVDGDVDVFGLTLAEPGAALSLAPVVGGASALVDATTRRFDHVDVGGRSTIIGGTVTRSPALPSLLDGVVQRGSGEPLDLASPGEIVLRVEPGWAPVVSRQVAALLAPGRETSVVARYAPEPTELRAGVLGSVDSLVYVASGAVLVLGSGAVMVGTFFRVLAERRLLGLYRAVGGSASFVVLTITLEAALVGTVGSVLGTTAGLGAAAARSLVTGVPLVVPWALVAAGSCVGLVTNTVGALVPALRTVREPPLAAIRSR